MLIRRPVKEESSGVSGLVVIVRSAHVFGVSIFDGGLGPNAIPLLVLFLHVCSLAPGARLFNSSFHPSGHDSVPILAQLGEQLV